MAGDDSGVLMLWYLETSFLEGLAEKGNNGSSSGIIECPPSPTRNRAAKPFSPIVTMTTTTNLSSTSRLSGYLRPKSRRGTHKG